MSTKTFQGKALLQSESSALLFIDTLPFYVEAGKFKVHDFVVMPDHVHLSITVDNMMSIEKALQLIKEGYSYRRKKELGTWARSGKKAFPKCGSRIVKAF